MFDIRTLLYMLSATTALSAVVIYILYHFRLPIQGPSWWCGGSVMLVAGGLFIALRGVVPTVTSVVAGNVLVVWGYLVIYNGMTLFLGKRSFFAPRSILLLLTLSFLFALFLYWHSAVDPTLNVRLVAISCALGGINVAFLWTMLPYRKDSFGISFFMFWMLCFLLSNLLRLWASLSGACQGEYLFSGAVNSYYLAAYIVISLGSSYALVLMLSEELSHRLAQQNEVLEENIRLRDEVEAIRQHDLKSPIVPIISLGELVLSEKGLTDTARLYVEEMRKAAEKALENINRSLDLRGLEGGRYSLRPDQVDVAVLTGQVLEPLCQTDRLQNHRVRLSTNHEAGLREGKCVVCADEGLLRTMLGNLFKNAFEASGAEGCVEADLQCDGSAVQLTITNDGEVAQSLRDRFFEKYTTRGKVGGVGLGTYSAWLIAEAHGGEIRLDCSMQGRTRLVVLLPRTCPAVPSDS